MHLLTRLAMAFTVAFVVVSLCSAPARAQVVPPWLPGLSVKLLIRVIEFREFVDQEFRVRLDRRHMNAPRPAPPPPAILPVIDLAGELRPVRAAAPQPVLRDELVP